MRSWLSPGIRPSVFTGLARHISNYIGREVSLDFCEDASGPLPGLNPFQTGEVDLGWMCATAFVELRSVELIEAAWIPNDPGACGQPQYFADLFVAGDHLIHLEQLRGRRVGCNDPVSLSGYHALRIAIQNLGYELEDFLTVVFTGGHLQSLQALDAGAVDAIVIDSITASVERPELRPAQRLGPWPTQPLAAASSLDPRLRAQICAAVLCCTEDPKLARTLRDSGIQDFASVSARTYEILAGREASPLYSHAARRTSRLPA